jgi:transcription elongation factor
MSEQKEQVLCTVRIDSDTTPVIVCTGELAEVCPWECHLKEDRG